MDTYHGTSEAIAALVARGNVDVTKGGGELGRGFYTGEHLYLAKAWAFQISGDKRNNVVEFITPDDHVTPLKIEVLNHGVAALKRYHLKSTGATRTYLFGVDLVWAAIVGNEKISGDQYKWESKTAEYLLNSKSCLRTVI